MRQTTKTIVVIGQQGVGKTSIVHRLLEEPVDFSSYKPTIDDCYNITWKLPDGQYLQLQIIDTAAWNEFPAMQSLFIKMSHMVLLVYDVRSAKLNDLLTEMIEQVRVIKDDADIFVVGSKCDKLTKADSYDVRDVTAALGKSVVGHVCTSALRQQGIVGLRQLLLCSKSQLTEGHYTEFSHVPKKKQLMKKVHGMALGLNMWKKKKSKATLLIDHDPEKYKQPVVYPGSSCSMKLSDVVDNNFDNLFHAADQSSRHSADGNMYHPSDRRKISKSVVSFDHDHGKSKRHSEIEETLYRDQDDVRHRSGSVSPQSNVSTPQSMRRMNHIRQRSMDTAIVLQPPQSHKSHSLTRQKSNSHHNVKRSTVSPQSSSGLSSTASSIDQLSQSSAGSPRLPRRHHHMADHNANDMYVVSTHDELGGSMHNPRGRASDGDILLHVPRSPRSTRSSDGDLSSSISSQLNSLNLTSNTNGSEEKADDSTTNNILHHFRNFRDSEGLTTLRRKLIPW